MAAQALVQTHGLLKIDQAAGFERAQVCAGQGLRRDIGLKAATTEGDNSQTGAVDGNALPEEIGSVGKGRRDGENGAPGGTTPMRIVVTA